MYDKNKIIKLEAIEEAIFRWIDRQDHWDFWDKDARVLKDLTKILVNIQKLKEEK